MLPSSSLLGAAEDAGRVPPVKSCLGERGGAGKFFGKDDRAMAPCQVVVAILLFCDGDWCPRIQAAARPFKSLLPAAARVARARCADCPRAGRGLPCPCLLGDTVDGRRSGAEFPLRASVSCSLMQGSWLGVGSALSRECCRACVPRSSRSVAFASLQGNQG